MFKFKTPLQNLCLNPLYWRTSTILFWGVNSALLYPRFRIEARNDFGQFVELQTSDIVHIKGCFILWPSNSTTLNKILSIRYTRGSYAIPHVSLIFPLMLAIRHLSKLPTCIESFTGVSIESRRELWDSKEKCIKFHIGNSKWDPCDKGEIY
jgi:hypothetical protein